MKILIVFIFLIHTSCSFLLRTSLTNFNMDPKRTLSHKAKKLIDNSFKNINLSKLQDFHVHSIGVPDKNNNIWISPKLKNFWNIKSYFQYKIYLEASGVRGSKTPVNKQIINRLISLVSQDSRYGKIRVLAFDYNYLLNGKKDLSNSTFYIPNNYVWKLYKKYPKIVIPVMSVHPYKKTALKELIYWGKKGVKMIKWLPNAQNIDPSLKKLNYYYKVLKKYNMSLLTHTGEEQAVDAKHSQYFGNPLLLRRALNLGVNVIMAHFASMGKCKDLDSKTKSKKECFLLAMRLFKNKKYLYNLFADISAVTIFTHVNSNLGVLLDNQKFHHRLVNGSDYPLPAIDALYQTGQLVKLGYLTKKKAKLLDEIYKYNPLLFDFALKRNLTSPKNKKKFLPITFEVPELLR
ncbi:MAG: amidohydrolase family protein [Bdellovibrionales bacterium]|nr:amidohydrolase family protein [Bdellovibrionales bacterium]